MDGKNSIKAQQDQMHDEILGDMLYYLQGLGMPPLERRPRRGWCSFYIARFYLPLFPLFPYIKDNVWFKCRGGVYRFSLLLIYYFICFLSLDLCYFWLLLCSLVYRVIACVVESFMQGFLLVIDFPRIIEPYQLFLKSLRILSVIWKYTGYK